MAVWVFAYGKNNLHDQSGDDDTYVRILNSLDLDAIKIYDSLIEVRAFFKERSPSDLDKWLSTIDDEKYQEYLKSISAPLIPRSELYDYFENRAKETEAKNEAVFNDSFSALKSGLAKAHWRKLSKGGCTFELPGLNAYDTIRCARTNDLIWLTGPTEIFSVYGRPQSVISRASLDFYHDTFKSILRAFGSDFIVYGHEWSPVYGADDNNDFDSKDLLAQIESAGESSDSIHSMTDFYFEHL